MSPEIFIALLLPVLLVLAVILLIEVRRLRLQLQNKPGNNNDQLFHQIEAYHYIRDRLDLKQGIPFTTHWSASPDFLKIIANHCLDNRPAMIMECSSGVTSLVLARCCQLNHSGNVFSLEDGEDYAERSRQELARYDLQAHAQVMHAPLQPQQLHGQTWQWYSIEQLPQQSIDMLVIDGPSGFIQKLSRYPALPLLFDKLADDCVIFLDDAAREDEQVIVQRWLEEFPQLQHQYLNTERGCSVLHLHR